MANIYVPRNLRMMYQSSIFIGRVNFMSVNVLER